MKVTYQTIVGVREFLKSNAWQNNLQSEIDKIDRLLKVSPDEQAKQKAARMPADKAKSRYPGILKGMQKKADNLKKDKADLQSMIDNNEYKLGLKPFDTSTAKVWLANIHMLESSEFDQSAVLAVKNMLKKNFKKLYDAEVESVSNNEIGYIHQIAKIYKDILNSKDVLSKELSAEDRKLDPIVLERARLQIKQWSSVDHGFLRDTAKLLRQFEFFKQVQVDIHLLILHLAKCFSNIEDLNAFLLSHADFSNITTIATSMAIDSEPFDSTVLSDKEREIWSNLNAKYGAKSIELFHQSVVLKKHIDIVGLYNSGSNLSELFAKIEETSKNLHYSRADENPELEKLCVKYHIREYHFHKILDEVLPNVKKDSLLPDISKEFKFAKKGFKIEKLAPGDLSGLFLGKMTNCCQFYGGNATKCVIDGFTRPDCDFYVIKDSKGKVKAMLYAWIGLDLNGNKVVMFDSFESLPEGKKLFPKVIELLHEAVQKSGFADMYIGAGGGTPKLTLSTIDAIKPIDSKIFQYADSKSAYCIKSSVGKLLLNMNIDNSKTDFETFINKLLNKNLLKLTEQYCDTTTFFENKLVMEYFLNHTDSVYKLFATGLLKADDFFANPSFYRYLIISVPQGITIEELQIVAQYCEANKIEDLYDIGNTIRVAEFAKTPLISTQLPDKIKIIISLYTKGALPEFKFWNDKLETIVETLLEICDKNSDYDMLLWSLKLLAHFDEIAIDNCSAESFIKFDNNLIGHTFLIPSRFEKAKMMDLEATHDARVRVVSEKSIEAIGVDNFTSLLVATNGNIPAKILLGEATSEQVAIVKRICEHRVKNPSLKIEGSTINKLVNTNYSFDPSGFDIEVLIKCAEESSSKYSLPWVFCACHEGLDDTKCVKLISDYIADHSDDLASAIEALGGACFGEDDLVLPS